MIIENTEALRDWLTKYLEPLCDADPIALAKYVMALIKKDKPEKDLKTVCLDQLEVFLQKETITFVDTLFETIANKSYLNSAVNANPTITSSPTIVSRPLPTDQTVTVPTDTITPTVVKSPEVATNSSNNNNNNIVNISNNNRSTEPHISSNPQTTNKSDSTHESSHRIRDQNKRNRSRSRSRSPLRNQRRNEFDSRRLGPIPNRNNGNNYFNDDRRNRRGQPNRRAGNQRFGGYRNDRNDRDYRRPRDMKRNRSRSRSRTYSSDSSRSRSRSRSWSPRDRERESPLNKKSRPSSRSPSPPKTTSQKDGEKSNKCRDYEEKGFCLKGHLCPYDHGTDPVVLDRSVSAALGFTNNTGPANAPLMPIPNSGVATNPPNSYLAEPYNPEAPGMDPQRPHPPQGPPPPMGPRMPPPYWAPPMPMRGPLPPRPLPPPQFIPPPGRPRELIGVPTIDNNLRHPHSNRTVIEPSIPMGHRGGLRGGLMKHGRGGYRNVRRINNESADKTCLEVRKIPANLNTISHLNQHFSKFGTIVNLQVCHEGDPEAALVQYTTHTEALSAIRSTEAVLNNRFIKVFWHSKELQQKHEQVFGVKTETTDETESNSASGGSAKISIKDRLGPKVNETESVLTAVNSSGTISRTVFDPSKLKKNNTNQNNNQKDNTNANQINNSQTDDKTSDSSAVKNKSPMTDKTNKKQITSKQYKILEEMINNQKQLMAKLEKSTNDNEKKMIKDTIDLIANKIKIINESIKKMMSQKTVKKPQTRDELMAEILNTDLDMFIKMQNKDVTYVELANKIAKLKRKEKTFGIRGRGTRGYPRNRGRGLTRRGSFQYGGRPSNPMLKVDRRTRKLLIPDINEDDITDLLEHLAQFSDVEVIEPSTNGAVVTFKTRMDAEKAIQNMSQIKFKENFQLSYSWFNENIAKSLDKKSSIKTISTEPKSENETIDREIETLGDEELLDYEEDDTEDESEARNWKA